MHKKIDRMNKQCASFFMKQKRSVLSVTVLIEEMA